MPHRRPHLAGKAHIGAWELVIRHEMGLSVLCLAVGACAGAVNARAGTVAVAARSVASDDGVGAFERRADRLIASDDGVRSLVLDRAAQLR